MQVNTRCYMCCRYEFWWSEWIHHIGELGSPFEARKTECPQPPAFSHSHGERRRQPDEWHHHFKLPSPPTWPAGKVLLWWRRPPIQRPSAKRCYAWCFNVVGPCESHAPLRMQSSAETRCLVLPRLQDPKCKISRFPVSSLESSHRTPSPPKRVPKRQGTPYGPYQLLLHGPYVGLHIARSKFWLPLDVKDGGLTQTWVSLAPTTIWLGCEGLINFHIHSMMTINERRIPLLSQSVLVGSDSWPRLRFSTSLIFHWYSSYKVSLLWIRCSVGYAHPSVTPLWEAQHGNRLIRPFADEIDWSNENFGELFLNIKYSIWFSGSLRFK